MYIKKWLTSIWILILLFQGNALFAMGKRPQNPRYNVLLITIDTLRADHLACYGYTQIKTPHIDGLASGGVLFTQAVTPVPITLPSHTSIMTGQYPLQHGVRNNGNFILDQKAITLAEIMKENGYQTGACIGAFVLDSAFGLDQGFDFYNDDLPARRKQQTDLLYNDRKAEEITATGLRWLEEKKDTQFFLWLHYFDPHASYSPPYPFSRDYQSHPYDGEIAYTDKCLGDLFQGMDTMGLLDKTLIILTADHGEGLGEHKEDTHAIFIYEATLHVPLIIKGPGGVIPKAKSISAMVSIIDILPTVLELYGIKKPANLAGKSLLPLIGGGADQIHEKILVESLCPELNFGWSRLEGIRTGTWKYIRAPLPEIYNLKDDPTERKNLIEQNKEARIRWKKELDGLKNTYHTDSTPGKEIRMSSEVQERLRSLGYIWTGHEKDETKERRDPKEMIHLMNVLNQGVNYLQSYYYDPAIECFKKVIEVNPDNDAAYFHLGVAYLKKELYDLAESAFREVLRMNSSFLDVHNQLGLVYYLKGEYDKALEEFELARVCAEYPEVHYNLSLVYDKLGQPQKAIAAIEDALRSDPNYADAYNHAGNIFLNQGDMNKAALNFERTIKIDPLNSSAYNNLGLIYSKQGKMQLALEHFQEAAALDPDNPEAHNNLGGIYLGKGNYHEAVTECTKALTLRPDYKKALINLGIAYFYLRDYTQAEHAYRRVLELDDNYPELYNQYGQLYLARGEFSEALSCFKKMVFLKPNDPEAYYNMGKAYQALGDNDQAIYSWGKALSLNPHLNGVHLNLGNAYFEKELVESAIKEWNIALVGKNIDVVTHLINLGMAYSQMGEYDKAIRAWKKAKEMNPEDPNPYYYLGSVYYHQGLYELAYGEIRESIRLQPGNQQAYSLLEKINELRN
ncbi:MAG: tetratricopeptide repeat protein [bacterium]